MSLVVPNIADLQMLKYVVNFIATDGDTPPSGGNRLLRLYTNNLTPGKSTVLGDITEATEAGYAPLVLVGTNWTIATNLGVNTASYALQTFTFTEAVTAYGYYLTTQDDELLWVEKFSDGPYTLPSDGGQMAVTPKLNFN